MKKTSDIITRNGSYETTYQAIYRANKNITTNEAEDLRNKHYRTFPVTKSAYALNGKHMTVVYTIDSCD